VGEAPPVKSNQKGTSMWAPLLDAARQNPGEWVSVTGKRTGNARSSILRGVFAGMADERWDACSRRANKPDERLYVRYLGTTDNPIDTDEVA